MSETNPQAGVAQPSIEDRVLAAISQPEGHDEEPQPVQEKAPQQEQPEGQAEPEEEADPAGEVETEETQPAVEAFEIVHNGQQHTLTLEEAIKYAQQGFDYTQKTQALAEKHRLADERLQRVAQVEQLTPLVQSHLAQVQAIEAQLAPYQNVDWIALAQDPQSYAAHQAQFLTLQRSHQAAVSQLQQAQGQAKQHVAAIKQQQFAQEEARLPELIPEWRDQAKKEAGKADLLKWFQAQGIPQQLVDSKLDDAFSVAVAYKAMKWDQLQRSKADTSKTLRQKPPVTVPGAAQSTTAKADQTKQLRQRLKKTGSMDDAVAILLNGS